MGRGGRSLTSLCVDPIELVLVLDESGSMMPYTVQTRGLMLSILAQFELSSSGARVGGEHGAILAARCVRGRARERCPATDGDLNALIYFWGGHCAGLVVVRGRGCELVLFL